MQDRLHALGRGPGTVYSRDIKFTDPTVKPAFEKIPIVILGDGEKLVAEDLPQSAWEKTTQNGSQGRCAATRTCPR
jgi:hypothetical protein